MPTSVAQVRRRRWRRLAPVSLVGAAGAANVLTGLVPELSSDLAALAEVDPASSLVLTGRVAAVEVGLALLVLARALARGSRRAWWLAFVLTTVAAGLGATRAQVSPTVLLTVLAAVLLLLTRSSFRLRRLSASPARWWVLVVVASGLVAFAVVGYREVEQRASPSTGSLLDALWETSFLPGGADAEPGLVTAYALAVRLGLLIVVGTALWAAWPPATGAEVDRDQIRAFAVRYGTSLDRAAARAPGQPPAHCAGSGLGRGGVSGGAAICLGAPVAARGREGAALRELRATASRTAGPWRCSRSTPTRTSGRPRRATPASRSASRRSST